ncbi:ribosomal protein L18ae, putative [Trichomonas vaginalis G3]|uniref:60S ribosomal protein L18a n=1 Tax=Trichomonas vaginalis (strain ATCC PRA-98 / G3) TaxID=412133 RepID=A2FSH1_TRIV3|nr:structural constituent of ribosome [Trichomonas vaginalis G3]EAX92142.1 ribosomal protein L18ae, putative [Trichomonas vaginalis G3]KAI5510186.1 structural constituent of ribosome [Trichomonas vaginalis G3]|eukprot:XP_001305072.1 ribosomal protein L18ae [Trichomonas vaginalis G3]
MSLKQYLVIGRPYPTKEIANPPAVRVQVFAPDEVIAKSKFWTVAQRIARLKKAHGEVLAVKHVIEPEPTRVKNYGIWLSYRSTRNHHNVYKEYRDTTTEGAVTKMLAELAGTHDTTADNISIIKVAEVADKDLVHKNISQFTHENIKFPILKQSIRAPTVAARKVFSGVRPTVCGF